jgi:hypothetical protein
MQPQLVLQTTLSDHAFHKFVGLGQQCPFKFLYALKPIAPARGASPLRPSLYTRPPYIRQVSIYTTKFRYNTKKLTVFQYYK